MRPCVFIVLCTSLPLSEELDAATRLGNGWDGVAGCVCFNLLADHGPYHKGGVRAQIRGNNEHNCYVYVLLIGSMFIRHLDTSNIFVVFQK